MKIAARAAVNAGKIITIAAKSAIIADKTDTIAARSTTFTHITIIPALILGFDHCRQARHSLVACFVNKKLHFSLDNVSLKWLLF